MCQALDLPWVNGNPFRFKTQLSQGFQTDIFDLIVALRSTFPVPEGKGTHQAPAERDTSPWTAPCPRDVRWYLGRGGLSVGLQVAGERA